MDIKITGGTPDLQKRILASYDSFPTWYLNGARIREIVVSSDPIIVEQIAAYQHGSRILYISPDIGVMLQKAMGHELAHACDDNFGNAHFFSSNPMWTRIHRMASYFDIPKYEQQSIEYFADQVTKLLMMGSTKLATTNSREVTFIKTFFFATLQREFGN